MRKRHGIAGSPVQHLEFYSDAQDAAVYALKAARATKQCSARTDRALEAFEYGHAALANEKYGYGYPAGRDAEESHSYRTKRAHRVINNAESLIKACMPSESASAGGRTVGGTPAQHTTAYAESLREAQVSLTAARGAKTCQGRLAEGLQAIRSASVALAEEDWAEKPLRLTRAGHSITASQVIEEAKAVIRACAASRQNLNGARRRRR